MQLRVLLHHYYSPQNWSEEQCSCPAASDATDYWMRCGCLEEVDNSGRDSGLQLTQRGLAMVKVWLAQPLPEAAWADEQGRLIDLAP
jgi:hypothetical protein